MPLPVDLRFVEHIAKIKVSSVTDRLFIFASIFTALAIIVFYLDIEFWIRLIFAIGVGFTWIFGFFFYAYFAITNPDYLRGEAFHAHKETLMSQGDSSQKRAINIADTRIVSNPEAIELESDNLNLLRNER